MRCSLLVVAFALASSVGAQTTTRMSILVAGGKAGENVYTVRPDGSFTSKTTLDVGGMKIKSDIVGQTDKEGRLVHFTVDQAHPASGTVRFVLKDGKVNATVAGKTSERPYGYKGKEFFGNFHPQLTASTLKGVPWEIGKSRKVRPFMLEGGAEPEMTVTPLGEKTTPAGTARLYKLEIGGMTVDMAMTEAGVLVGEEVASQQLRFVADGWDALYKDPFAKYPELSQPTYGTRLERDVKMKTKDGVLLVADIVRPDAPGKFPTILVRTPYGRGAEMLAGERYAKRGYVYIAQDCRGRNDSDGAWDPFVNEEQDGVDTLDWIVSRPWSDGKVGMIGASYGGLVQWSAAVRKHPALKCIVPQVSPPDAMRNIPYDHGIFFLYGNLWWGRIVSGKQADLGAIAEGMNRPELMNTLPLSRVDDVVLGQNVPFFDKWLDRTRLRDWKGYDQTWRLREVDIPALHISGWWDGDNIGTKLNWAEMRAAGRKNQWLIYGPWTHAFNTTSKLGDVDYGEKAILELDPLYVRWFDTWLKGKSVGMEKVPRVQAFVTGANLWIPLPDWPASTTPVKTLYLASSGRLLDKPLAQDRPTRYTYDPAKDVIPKGTKSIGGSGAESSTKLEGVEADKGTLVFRSAPLKAAMAIGGPLEVNLAFQTSARDTDFYAMLVDIAPTGEIRAFGQSGKLRASYMTGMDNPRPLTPNRTYRITIHPWDTAHELKAGHRLGLLVKSSLFPVYARNLGTGEPIKNATRMIVQRNTILHDAKNPSSIKFRVLW
ncbi:MAG: CocE/NonD family hydrolase [Fimbriimonas sp.]